MRLLVLALVMTAGLGAEQFPHIEGKNLLGQKMALPDAAAGHEAVVVIGFSHAAQDQTKPWIARLRKEIPTYSVAVLQDAPRLVRGMIVHAMKGEVPKDERGNFLVVLHDKTKLMQAAGFVEPNDAYVLLLDKTGAIVWEFHGPVTDEAIAQLKAKRGSPHS